MDSRIISSFDKLDIGQANDKLNDVIRRNTTEYVDSPLGIKVKTVDFRTVKPREYKPVARPVVPPGDLYVDPDFPMEKACEGMLEPGLRWKRPWQFVKNPALFTDGATRFDIGQGCFGTCWFLSVVADLCDHEHLIEQIIPKDAYPIQDPQRYDGVFHARFFRFGRWEDVYIDDFLPIYHDNRPWGAKSATDQREMWVALLEKAFAKLHGSYGDVTGGKSCDAYQLLTGGIAEPIELIDFKDNYGALHKRVSNAIGSGSQVTCSVPSGNVHHGLIGGHTYSLVGTTVVGNTMLVRVRNPWGCGEWVGPWSDGSPEWETIPDRELPNEDDGEFYMSMTDFMTFFARITICSITPDIDCDGISDNLNYVMNGFGNWRQGCAGGFRNLFNNPRYCFEIPEEGLDEDDKAPMVIQIIQHAAKRKTDIIDIRLDIFEILGDRRKQGRRTMAMEAIGPKSKTVTYTRGMSASYRHRLDPGRYMLIPSTKSGNQFKEFLIRCFAPIPCGNIVEISQDVQLVTCEPDDAIVIGGIPTELDFEKIMFGDFIAGKNAGGQASFHETFHTNPQYVISIPPQGGRALISIHLIQIKSGLQYPIGIRLFHLESGVRLPVDFKYINKQYPSSPKTLEAKQSKFMHSWNVDVKYMLNPGKYLAIIFLDQPGYEKEFCLVWRCSTDIKVTGYQTK